MSAYIFDVEATDKESPEIIEAAWLRFGPVEDLAGVNEQRIPSLSNLQHSDGDRWEQRYKPAGRVTFGAIATHHIFPDELEDCSPSSAFALPTDCAYLIGHSIDFDWKAAGSPAHVKRICTDAIARHTWQDADAYSLVALVYMCEGKRARELAQSAHGALADCDLVAILLQHILVQHPEVETWEQLWCLSEQCRIPLVLPFSKHKGTRLEELEPSMVDWCLRQDWIEPYLRVGLERVARGEHPQTGKSLWAPVTTADQDDDIPF